MRKRRSSLLSKRTPKVLSGLRQLTWARTQMRGSVSKANETSNSIPIETSSGLLTDIPPVLISLLQRAEVPFRFLGGGSNLLVRDGEILAACPDD